MNLYNNLYNFVIVKKCCLYFRALVLGVCIPAGIQRDRDREPDWKLENKIKDDDDDDDDETESGWK